MNQCCYGMLCTWAGRTLLSLSDVLIDLLTILHLTCKRNQQYQLINVLIVLCHTCTNIAEPKSNIDMILSFLDSSSLLFTFFMTAIVVIFTLNIYSFFSRRQVGELDKKYVLITGCDSGFGQETAIRMDKMGIGVLATCLTKEGEQSLKSATSDRLKTFQLDVTNSQQIKTVYEKVKEQLSSDQGSVGMLNILCKKCRIATRRYIDLVALRFVFPFTLKWNRAANL